MSEPTTTDTPTTPAPAGSAVISTADILATLAACAARFGKPPPWQVGVNPGCWLVAAADEAALAPHPSRSAARALTVFLARGIPRAVDKEGHAIGRAPRCSPAELVERFPEIGSALRSCLFWIPRAWVKWLEINGPGPAATQLTPGDR